MQSERVSLEMGEGYMGEGMDSSLGPSKMALVAQWRWQPAASIKEIPGCPIV